MATRVAINGFGRIGRLVAREGTITRTVAQPPVPIQTKRPLGGEAGPRTGTAIRSRTCRTGPRS